MTFIVRKFTTHSQPTDEIVHLHDLVDRFPYLTGMINRLTQSFYLKLVIDNERIDIEKI